MYVIAIYLMLASVIFVEQVKQIEINKYFKLFFYVAITFFFVLRFNIGPDLNSYIHIFYRVNAPVQDAFKYHMQRNLGFNMWVYYIKKLFGSYQSFVLCTNVFNLSICSFVILRNSKNIWLSLLLLIGSGILEVYYASGIRQMMAMAIFFYAFYQKLQHKKYAQYYVLSIVAILFHESALPTLFLPILMKQIGNIKKNPKKFVIAGTLLATVGYVFTTYGMPIIANHIGASTPLQHVNSYFVNAAGSISMIGIAMEVVFALGCIALYRAMKDHNDIFLYAQLIVVLASVFLYLAFARYPIVSRVCDFLQIVLVIFVPNALHEVSYGKIRNLLLVGIVGLNLFLLTMDLKFKIARVQDTQGEEYGLMNYPYFTVFNQKETQSRIAKVVEWIGY